MNVIDTSLLTERIKEGKPIHEDIILISLIEYPTLLEYSGFHGKTIEPELVDLKFAHELQKRLAARGRMKGAADLIIAATCIHLGAKLLTRDRDFEDIRKVSDLNVIIE
jgi:hypothetical protein